MFSRNDEGIAGSGSGLRMDLQWATGDLDGSLRQISALLERLRERSSGTPVAFVTVPFTSSSPITVAIPAVALRRSAHGEEQVVVDLDAPLQEALPPIEGEQTTSPGKVTVRSSRPPEDWTDAVRKAVQRISNGELDKVVLAREVLVESERPFQQDRILSYLRRSYPSSCLFAIDGLVGASPELLIERQGTAIHTLPLAGTFPRSGDAETDRELAAELLRSSKDLSEHRYLSEMVSDALRPYCTSLDVPEQPEVMSLANVHHLATPISGVLADSTTGVLELVACLHPTPAIGGRPTEAAVRTISELESLNRGRYAGAVGWIDADGNGCFAVAIRCAQLTGRVASVMAGGGIVASSDPDRELEETRWKLQAMLSALIRP